MFGIHGIGGISGAILTAVWCAPKLGGNGFGTIVLSGGEAHPIREIGTQLGVQLASVCYAVVWSVVCTFVLLKIIDVCHGGFNLRLINLTNIRCTPKEEEVGLDDAYFAEQGYNFVVQDMNISVEVGPLRGRKGHGLQLYYTDEEGTRHPIAFDEAAEDDSEQQEAAAARIQASAAHGAKHENIARALYSEGGVVQMKLQGNDSKVVAEKISTPGSSQHGPSAAAAAVASGASSATSSSPTSPQTPSSTDESRVYGAGSMKGGGGDAAAAMSSPTSTLK